MVGGEVTSSDGNYHGELIKSLKFRELCCSTHTLHTGCEHTRHSSGGLRHVSSVPRLQLKTVASPDSLYVRRLGINCGEIDPL